MHKDKNGWFGWSAYSNGLAAVGLRKKIRVNDRSTNSDTRIRRRRDLIFLYRNWINAVFPGASEKADQFEPRSMGPILIIGVSQG